VSANILSIVANWQSLVKSANIGVGRKIKKDLGDIV
jgi:hypothetical protein